MIETLYPIGPMAPVAYCWTAKGARRVADRFRTLAHRVVPAFGAHVIYTVVRCDPATHDYAEYVRRSMYVHD